MVLILVDYNNIIEPHLSYIKEFLKNLPQTSFSIGIVFDIDDESFDYLESLQSGKPKIDYLDTDQFIKSIRSFSYIIYNKSSKYCEIDLVEGNLLEETVEIALEYLPNDTMLFIFIPLDRISHRLISSLAQLGFGEPFISDGNPFNLHRNTVTGIYLSKLNFLVDPKNISYDIEYALQNFYDLDKNFCEVSFVFSEKTLKFFKKLSKIGSSWNGDKNITQKEIGGKLIPSSLDENFLVTLDIDISSLILGEEEGVKVVGSLFNFHSHPKEAYQRHEVELGWPSTQDYIAFLSTFSHYNTILHVVIAVEGIYIISLSDFWFEKNLKLTKSQMKDIIKFIEDNYKLDKKQLSIKQYVKNINALRYKDKQLIEVNFVQFKDCGNPLKVKYYKRGKKCIFNQQNFF